MLKFLELSEAKRTERDRAARLIQFTWRRYQIDEDVMEEEVCVCMSVCFFVCLYVCLFVCLFVVVVLNIYYKGRYHGDRGALWLN